MRYDTESLTSTAWQPALGIVVYLVVNAILGRNLKKKAPKNGSEANGQSVAAKGETEKASKGAVHVWTPLNTVAIVHNTVMAIYSGVTFLMTVQYMADKFTVDQIYHKDCDYLMKGSLKTLSYLFYLSKYYEFMDTWLLLLKGKRPIFLQKFHHIGAVIIMWGVVSTDTESTWVWVLFNSLIHTIMYTYYLLTCFDIRPWWKKYITTLQLLQFVSGFTIGLPYFFLGCMHGPSLWAVSVNYAYISYLIYLFGKFYVATYAKPKSKGKSA